MSGLDGKLDVIENKFLMSGMEKSQFDGIQIAKYIEMDIRGKDFELWITPNP